MASVQLKQLEKSFQTQKVVHPMDLQIQEGEFVVLIGPSGCGKSTLLRMIAGLEPVSGGQIFIGDQDLTDAAPRDRNVAMVFQDYALYPHMSVRDNIGFGLKLRGVSDADREKEIAQAANMLEIGHLLDRKPAALSGGQRQRVAMGRCLVRKADAFLFDEPLSNLDAKLRATMRAEIKRFHRSTGVTTIYVTHDQVEAMTLADRIVCLDGGRIAQQGTPSQLYGKPVNKFVAGFIGSPPMNFVPAKFDHVDGGACVVLPDGQKLAIPDERAAAITAKPGQAVLMGIRPEHLTDAGNAQGVRWPARIELPVVLTELLGADTLVHAKAGKESVIARCAPHAVASDTDRITLVADMAHVHLFATEGGAALRA
ncbi:MAG TPA: sn-glycerol-3-phosphate ABC transporter ATP-binding protein UgpC [Polaromonas sp.]|uniref:ABC transporter ATP-binding protein n=1 Tax=Polaromonas sp. TaxID=1869339 RepID=UPI002D695D6F|nr:sn-glycerol-3-phosphate ABC transporter ATP-binding protein UgpC [Polaromonas sp.]HYW58124.1 sn-glycerol-3-phosphate ABC transporter ATP-binding protein UgpC [Polaromonas sp.]